MLSPEQEQEILVRTDLSEAALARRLEVSRWTIRAIRDPHYKEQERLRRRLPRKDGETICFYCEEKLTNHKRCKDCDMLLHDQPFIATCGQAHTLAVGDRCIGCAEGMQCGHPHDLEEISKQFGYSRERVRQLEQGAYQKIKEKLALVEDMRTTKPCEVCGKDMYVSAGQVAYYHKQCRALRDKKKHKHAQAKSN